MSSSTLTYIQLGGLSHCIEAKLQFEVPFGIAIAGAEKSKVLRHFQHFPASAGASTRPFRVADFVDFPRDRHDFRKDFKGFARPELARMRFLREPHRNLKDF